MDIVTYLLIEMLEYKEMQTQSVVAKINQFSDVEASV